METVRLKSNARKSTHSGKPSPGNQEQRRLRESLRWRSGQKQDANSNVNLPQKAQLKAPQKAPLKAPQKVPLKVSQKAPQKAPLSSSAGKRTGWSLSARARSEDKEEEDLLVPIEVPERKESAATNGAASCEGLEAENVNGHEKQDMNGLSEHETKNQDQRSLWSLFSSPKLADKRNGDLSGEGGTSLSESGRSNENNSRETALTSKGTVQPKSFAIKPSKNIFSKMKPLKKSRNIFANFGKSVDAASKAVEERVPEKCESVKDVQKKSEIDEITEGAEISVQKRTEKQVDDRTCESKTVDNRTKADEHDDVLKDLSRTEEPLEELENKLPEDTSGGDAAKLGDEVCEQNKEGDSKEMDPAHKHVNTAIQDESEQNKQGVLEESKEIDNAHSCVLKEVETSNEKRYNLRTSRKDSLASAQDSQPPSLPAERIRSDSLSDISCDMDEGGGLVIDEEPPTLAENPSDLTSKKPVASDAGHVLRVWSLQSEPGGDSAEAAETTAETLTTDKSESNENDATSQGERTMWALDCIQTKAAEKNTLCSDDVRPEGQSEQSEHSGVDAVVRNEDDLNETPMPRLEEDVIDTLEKSQRESAEDAVETNKDNITDIATSSINKTVTGADVENVREDETATNTAVGSSKEEVSVATAKDSGESEADASAPSISDISSESNNRPEVQPEEQHVPNDVDNLARNKTAQDGEDSSDVHLGPAGEETLDKAEASESNIVSPIRNIFSLFSRKGEPTSTNTSETVDSENLMHVTADISKPPQIEESPTASIIPACNSEKQSYFPTSSSEKQSNVPTTSPDKQSNVPTSSPEKKSNVPTTSPEKQSNVPTIGPEKSYVPTTSPEKQSNIKTSTEKQSNIKTSPEKQSNVPTINPEKKSSSLEGTSEVVCAVPSLGHEDAPIIPTHNSVIGQDSSDKMIVEGDATEKVTLVQGDATEQVTTLVIARTDDPAAMEDSANTLVATQHNGESFSLQTDDLDILHIPNLILELQEEQSCAEQRTDDISNQPPNLLPEKEVTPVSQHEEDQIEDMTFFSFNDKDSLYSFAKKSKVKMRKKPPPVANKVPVRHNTVPIQKPTSFKPVTKREEDTLEVKIRSLERHFLWSMDIQGLTEIAHPALRKRGLNLKKIAESNQSVLVKEEELYKTSTKKHKPKPKSGPKSVLNKQSHISKETKMAKETKSADKSKIKNSDSLPAQEWEILSDGDGQKSDRPSLKLKFITKSKATSTPPVQQSPFVLSTKPKTCPKPVMSSTSQVNVNVQQLQVRSGASIPRPVNQARPEKSMDKVIKLEAEKTPSGSGLQNAKSKSKKSRKEKPAVSSEPPEEKSPRPPIEESLPFKPFEKPVVSKKSAFVSDALEDLLEGTTSSKESGSLITPGSMAASTAQVVFKVPSKQSHSVKTLAMALKRQKPVEVSAKRERSHQFAIDDDSGLLKKKKKKKKKHKLKEDMECPTSVDYEKDKPVTSRTLKPPKGYVYGTGPDNLVKKLPTLPFSYYKRTYPSALFPKKNEDGHQGFLQVRTALSASDKTIIKEEPKEMEPFEIDDDDEPQLFTTSRDSDDLLKPATSESHVPKPPVKREADNSSPETAGPVEKIPRTCGESCRLGCICDSIHETRSVKEMTVHCRQESCMLTCVCQKSSSYGTIRTRRRPAFTSEMLFYDDTYKFWKAPNDKSSAQPQSGNKKVKLLDLLSAAEKGILQTTSARTRVFESDKVINAKERKRRGHKNCEQSDSEAKSSDPTVESASCPTLPPSNHNELPEKEEFTTANLHTKQQFISLSDLSAISPHVSNTRLSSESDFVTPGTTRISTASDASASKAAVVTAGMSSSTTRMSTANDASSSKAAAVTAGMSSSTVKLTERSLNTTTQAKIAASAPSRAPKGSGTAKRGSDTTIVSSTLLPVAKQYYLGPTLMNLIVLPNGNRILVPAKQFPPVVVVNGTPSVPKASQASSSEKPPNSGPPVSLYVPMQGSMQSGSTSQRSSAQLPASSSSAKNVQAGKGDPGTTQVFRNPLASVPSTSASQTQPGKTHPSDGTDRSLPRAAILQKAVPTNVSSSGLKGAPKFIGPASSSASKIATSGGAPMHFEFTSSGLKTTTGSNQTEAPTSASKLPVHLTLQGNLSSGKDAKATTNSKSVVMSSKPVIDKPDVAMMKTAKPTDPLGSSTNVINMTSTSPLHHESLRPSAVTSLPTSKASDEERDAVKPVKGLPASSPVKTAEPTSTLLGSPTKVANTTSTPPFQPESLSPSAVSSLPTSKTIYVEQNSDKPVNRVLDFTELKSREGTSYLNSSTKVVGTTSTSPSHLKSSSPSSFSESVVSVCNELSTSPKRISADAHDLKMPTFSCYVVVAGKKNQEFLKVAIHAACQWKSQKSDVMKAVAKLVKSKEGCVTADVGDDLQLRLMYMSEKEGAVLITSKTSKELEKTTAMRQLLEDGTNKDITDVAEKAESKDPLEMLPISSGVQEVSDIHENRTKSQKDESESPDKMIGSLKKEKSGDASTPPSVDKKDEVVFTDKTRSTDREPSSDVSSTPAADKTAQDSGKLSSSLPEFDKLSAIVKRSPYASPSKQMQGAPSYDWLNESSPTKPSISKYKGMKAPWFSAGSPTDHGVKIVLERKKPKFSPKGKGMRYKHSPAKPATSNVSRDTSSGFTNLKPLLCSEEMPSDSGDNINIGSESVFDHNLREPSVVHDGENDKGSSDSRDSDVCMPSNAKINKDVGGQDKSSPDKQVVDTVEHKGRNFTDEQESQKDTIERETSEAETSIEDGNCATSSAREGAQTGVKLHQEDSSKSKGSAGTQQSIFDESSDDDERLAIVTDGSDQSDSDMEVLQEELTGEKDQPQLKQELGVDKVASGSEERHGQEVKVSAKSVQPSTASPTKGGSQGKEDATADEGTDSGTLGIEHFARYSEEDALFMFSDKERAFSEGSDLESCHAPRTPSRSNSNVNDISPRSDKSTLNSNAAMNDASPRSDRPTHIVQDAEITKEEDAEDKSSSTQITLESSADTPAPEPPPTLEARNPESSGVDETSCNSPDEAILEAKVVEDPSLEHSDRKQENLSQDEEDLLQLMEENDIDVVNSDDDEIDVENICEADKLLTHRSPREQHTADLHNLTSRLMKTLSKDITPKSLTVQRFQHPIMSSTASEKVFAPIKQEQKVKKAKKKSKRKSPVQSSQMSRQFSDNYIGPLGVVSLKYSKKDKKKKDSISLDEDDDSPVPRTNHNMLERRRREELRTFYRTLATEMDCDKRTAKIAILKKAIELIATLTRQERALKERKKRAEHRNRTLIFVHTSLLHHERSGNIPMRRSELEDACAQLSNQCQDSSSDDQEAASEFERCLTQVSDHGRNSNVPKRQGVADFEGTAAEPSDQGRYIKVRKRQGVSDFEGTAAKTSDQGPSGSNPEKGFELLGPLSKRVHQRQSDNIQKQAPKFEGSLAQLFNQGNSWSNQERVSELEGAHSKPSTQGKSALPSNRKSSSNKGNGVSEMVEFIAKLSNQEKSHIHPESGYKFDGSLKQLTNKLAKITSGTSIKIDIKAETAKDASKKRPVLDNASSDEEVLPISCYVSSSDEHEEEEVEDGHDLEEEEEGAYSDDGFILDSDDDEGDDDTGMGSRGVNDGDIPDESDDEMGDAQSVQRTGDGRSDGVRKDKEVMPIKVNLEDPDFSSSSDSEVELMDVEQIEKTIVERRCQKSQTVNKNVVTIDDSSDEEPMEVTSAIHRDDKDEKLASQEKSVEVVEKRVEPLKISHVIDLSTRKVRESTEKEQSKPGSSGKPVNSVQLVKKDGGASSKHSSIDKPAVGGPNLPVEKNTAAKKRSPRKIVSVIDEIMARLGGKEASSEKDVEPNQANKDKAANPSSLVKESSKESGRTSGKLTDPKPAERLSILQTTAKQATSLREISKTEHVSMQQTVSKQMPSKVNIHSKADTNLNAPSSQVKPQKTSSAQQSVSPQTGTPAGSSPATVNLTKENRSKDNSTTPKDETKSTLPMKGALSDLISSIKSRVKTDYSSSDDSSDESDAAEDLPSSQSEVQKETGEKYHDGDSDEDAEDEDSSDDDSSDDDSIEEGEIKEELASEKPSTSKGHLPSTSKATVVGNHVYDFSDDSSDDSSIEDGEIRDEEELEDKSGEMLQKSGVTSGQTETKFSELNVSQQQNEDSVDSDDGYSISSIEMNLASDDDFEEDESDESNPSVPSTDVKQVDGSSQSKLVPSTSRSMDSLASNTDRGKSPMRNLFNTVLSGSRGSTTSKEARRVSDPDSESLSDIPLEPDSGDSQGASVSGDSQAAGVSGTADPILDEDVSFLDVEKNSDGTLNVVLKGDYDNKKLDELFEKPGVMDYLMSAAAKKQLE